MCDSRDLAKSKIDLVIESLDRLTAKIDEMIPLVAQRQGDREPAERVSASSEFIRSLSLPPCRCLSR